MLIKQFPFNPNTAQNGEDYMHRTFGHCVYIGKSPSDSTFTLELRRLFSTLT